MSLATVMVTLRETWIIENQLQGTSSYTVDCGGPIVWASMRQRCTALSTTEAEYIAGCKASKEAVWIVF